MWNSLGGALLCSVFASLSGMPGVLSMCEGLVGLEICKVNTAFGVFDKSVDQGRLKEAIKLVLESKQGKGRGDEEAGLDEEEEENYGEDILDFLK
jgi:hypothetical protein